MKKIEVKINKDDPFNYYLENEKGDKFHFNPHTVNGENLDSFLMGAKESLLEEREKEYCNDNQVTHNRYRLTEGFAYCPDCGEEL